MYVDLLLSAGWRCCCDRVGTSTIYICASARTYNDPGGLNGKILIWDDLTSFSLIRKGKGTLFGGRMRGWKRLTVSGTFDMICSTRDYWARRDDSRPNSIDGGFVCAGEYYPYLLLKRNSG